MKDDGSPYVGVLGVTTRQRECLTVFKFPSKTATSLMHTHPLLTTVEEYGCPTSALTESGVYGSHQGACDCWPCSSARSAPQTASVPPASTFHHCGVSHGNAPTTNTTAASASTCRLLAKQYGATSSIAQVRSRVRRN